MIQAETMSHSLTYKVTTREACVYTSIKEEKLFDGWIWGDGGGGVQMGVATRLFHQHAEDSLPSFRSNIMDFFLST